MLLVDQAIERLASPAEVQLELAVERPRHVIEVAERDPVHLSQLDPADDAPRQAASFGEVDLAPSPSMTERPDGSSEPKRVHRGMVVGDDHPRITRGLPAAHLRLTRGIMDVDAHQPIIPGEACPMCFDHDSRPPIRPIAGGAIDSRDVALTASDGNHLSAFEARAASPGGNGILILPDIRGLHEYYVELAMRFAERGIDAVAIDWFGRTAGLGRRADGFDFMTHVNETKWPAIAADIAAGAAHFRSLRSSGDTGGTGTSLFTIGFCFGGRNAFLSATLGLGLAGAIGFYGSPVGPGRGGSPAPADVAGEIASPILGLFGGADGSIPPEAIATFDRALTRAGVEHDLRSYPGAPLSFFDRKADQFAGDSADAWERVLAFIAGHGSSATTR